MRAVIQRVERAQVTVDGTVVGRIGQGLTVLLGVGSDDTGDDVAYLKKKLLQLRIFPDRDGKMNLSIGEVKGEILLVSQFTLYGDCRKGARPSFSRSAPAGMAQTLYHELIDSLSSEGIPVESGRFQAMMKVSLINDGPVTLILDSKKQFY